MPIIAIAGASGSGKTTLSKALLSFYGEQHCEIISADNYYKDLSHLTAEQKNIVNFDHPDTIDFALLSEHLLKLKNNSSTHIPIYDFKTHTRTQNTLTLHPKKMVIIEGILVLHAPELAKLIDVKIFVKAHSDLALIRRIERDKEERGRKLSHGILQYKNTVRLMFEKFVHPSQASADIIVKNNSMDKQIDADAVIQQITKLLEKKSSPQLLSLFSVSSSSRLGIQKLPNLDIYPEEKLSV
jgi:uridine kinase